MSDGQIILLLIACLIISVFTEDALLACCRRYGSVAMGRVWFRVWSVAGGFFCPLAFVFLSYVIVEKHTNVSRLTRDGASDDGLGLFVVFPLLVAYGIKAAFVYQRIHREIYKGTLWEKPML